MLDWCEAYGIQAVISLFSCEGYNWIEEPGDYRLWSSPPLQQELVDFWVSTAARYAKRGDVIYGYEILSEPHTAEGEIPRVWYQLSERIARAIRSVDPQHAISVEYGYGEPANFRGVTPLEVPNVIYSIHSWEPASFTHQGWSGRDYPAGVPYPGGGWNKDRLRDLIRPAYEFKTRYGVQVYVGEIGVYCYADSASRCAYLEDCLDLFEEYGFDYTFSEYRFWPHASLEHVGYKTPAKWVERYVGDTPALELFQSYLSRNGARTTVHAPLQRPRCLFDTSHWGANLDATVRVTNLAWRLTALCNVVTHSGGPITKEALEGTALLVTGDAFGSSYTEAEARVMKEFVNGGGSILVYGPSDWGLNPLLSSFGIQVNSARVLTTKPLTYADDAAGFYVRDFPGPPEITDGLVAFLVNYGASLEVLPPAVVVARTTADTWRDTDKDSVLDLSEARGPFPVIAVCEYRQGRIAVVADDEFKACHTWPTYAALVSWLLRMEPAS